MMYDILAAAAAVGDLPASTGNPLVDLGNKLQYQFGFRPYLFLAQCINFVIVAFVLKKFAFGPIGEMLAARRARIAEGEAKLLQIQQDLAASEQRTAATIEAANLKAQQLIDEAQSNASLLSEEKAQEAIHAAQKILAKADEAAQAERTQMIKELKGDFGKLVALATSNVAGKVLNESDHKKINNEALTVIEH